MNKGIVSKIGMLRKNSEAAWEMAADTARDESSAAEFIAAWDAWGEHWDTAETCLDSGDIPGAIAALEDAMTLENDGGDDSFARRAIELLTDGAAA